MATKHDIRNTFDEALNKLGQDVVELAVQQVKDAESSWERVRAFYTVMQSLGAPDQALDALFGPAEKIPARKALWYKRMKRLLTQANKLGIPIEDDMTLRDLQTKVSQTRVENRSPEEKEENALRMFRRTTKGVLNAAHNRDSVARTLLSSISTIEKRTRAH